MGGGYPQIFHDQVFEHFPNKVKVEQQQSHFCSTLHSRMSQSVPLCCQPPTPRLFLLFIWCQIFAECASDVIQVLKRTADQMCFQGPYYKRLKDQRVQYEKSKLFFVQQYILGCRDNILNCRDSDEAKKIFRSSEWVYISAPC